MDLFVVPTLGFDLLYAFVIVRIDRRDLVWINVTPHPTAKMGCTPNHQSIPVERSSALHDPRPGPDLWCACHAPTARHGHPGQAHSTSFALANGFAERLIGSIRSECLDHIIVLGEVHLRQILQSYGLYNGIELIDLWTRMSRSPARFSPPV